MELLSVNGIDCTTAGRGETVNLLVNTGISCVLRVQIPGFTPTDAVFLRGHIFCTG